MKFIFVLLVGFIIFTSLLFSNAYADSLAFDQNPIAKDHGSVITFTENVDGTPNESKQINVKNTRTNVQITVTAFENGSTGIFTTTWVFFGDTTGTNALAVTPGDTVEISVSGVSPNPQALIVSRTSTQTFSGTISNTLPTCIADVDKDGICDEFELSTGLSVKSGTSDTNPYILTCSTTTYSSNSLGEDVCPGTDKKDIYIEIDYLKGHRPEFKALKDIVNVFFTNNIRLHIQVDDNDKLDHFDVLAYPGADGGTGFNQIKNSKFGTSSERANPNWLPGDWQHKKVDVFHYVLFAHTLSGSGFTATTSGNSEILGNDIMITLGGWDGMVGSTSQQSGTLMHELGHNIGLHHGGSYSNTINCKPNYISIMSYSRQMPDLITNRELDYSKNAMASVIESPPSPGLSSYSTPEVTTVYGDSSGTPHLVQTGTASIPWTSYMRNINEHCVSGTPTTLTGFNDWANLKLNVKSSGWSSGDDPLDDLTADELKSMPDLQSQLREMTFEDSLNARLARAELLEIAMMQLPENVPAKQRILDNVIPRIKQSIAKGDTLAAIDDYRSIPNVLSNDRLPPEARRALDAHFPEIRQITNDNIRGLLTTVPEFSTFAMLVLAISIVSIIGISKSKFAFSKLS